MTTNKAICFDGPKPTILQGETGETPLACWKPFDTVVIKVEGLQGATPGHWQPRAKQVSAASPLQWNGGEYLAQRGGYLWEHNLLSVGGRILLMGRRKRAAALATPMLRVWPSNKLVSLSPAQSSCPHEGL